MSQYPQPQNVREWKKEIEAELLARSETKKDAQGNVLVKYKTAVNFMRRCFTKVFKVSRRDRASLTEHIMDEMEKRFIIKPK